MVGADRFIILPSWSFVVGQHRGAEEGDRSSHSGAFIFMMDIHFSIETLFLVI